jgi:hypothetical protein
LGYITVLSLWFASATHIIYASLAITLFWIITIQVNMLPITMQAAGR